MTRLIRNIIVILLEGRAVIRVRKVFCFVALLTILSLVTIGSVYANGDGSSGGADIGGNKPQSGCSSSSVFTTCYGATWRWYPANNQDSIWIPGGSGTYVSGGTVTGCADEGGYYRLAMVAQVNGAVFSKGEQAGLLQLNGNGAGNSFVHSEFGGNLHYRGKSQGEEYEWNEIRDIYLKAKEDRPENFPYGWDRNSALAWFCSPKEGGSTPVVTDYAANSGVGAWGGSVGEYVQTGVTNVVKTVNTQTVELDLSKGQDSATLVFAHNVYASEPGKTFKWAVSRSTDGINANGFSSSGYTITPMYTACNNGDAYCNTNQVSAWVADATGKNGEVISVGDQRDYYYQDGWYAGLYDGSWLKYHDTAYYFLLRDEYTVTFTDTGTYKFCESAYANGEQLTLACVTVNVVKPMPTPPPVGECGNWTPADYNSGVTSVLSKVRNNNLTGSYSGWKGSVNSSSGLTYAKPNDIVDWRNCYYPGAQAYYNTKVLYRNGTKIGSCYHGSCSGSVTNAKISSGITWNNWFRYETDSPYGLNNGNYIKSTRANVKENPGNGVTTVQEVKNNLIVSHKDVGKTYSDWIKTDGTPISVSTGSGTHTWRTCCGSCCCGLYGCSCCCSTSASHGYTTGTVTNGERESQSRVTIPYNFKNTASFNISKSSTNPVYSGETINISNATVHVGTRYNSVTEGTYSTRVDNAKVKMVAYTSSSASGSEKTGGSASTNICSLITGDKQCKELKSVNSTTLNSVGRTSGYDNGISSLNTEYNAFDAAAGDYMCFVMAVYPATSGSNTNTNSAGDGKWYVSAPKCAIIAKKPSFQIVGGGIYSDGNIFTTVSEKKNVYPSYSATGGNKTYFGSWVDQSVITNGMATLLASGASISGGSASGFCEGRVPLSFANYEPYNLCPTYNVTGWADVASSTENRSALVDYWLGDTTSAATVGAGTVNLESASSYERVRSATGSDIRYTKSSGDLRLTGASFGKNVTHIVRTTGNVEIDGNLAYTLANELKGSGDIPKLVIYAKNITINCHVSRVDAVLIAENGINTCPSAGDVNAAERSNQLIVRGMVISDSLELNRTYGASSGKYNYGTIGGGGNGGSNISAEVINYDASAILWGRYMAGSAESDTLTVTYQHELAPRY
ncbi:MAG: hypothetical protein Q4B65_00140 [Candidatus Saccharibacteria bacterium]|nr:hypothetical protein [Candidatus Saccharibacteria bacterium]